MESAQNASMTSSVGSVKGPNNVLTGFLDNVLHLYNNKLHFITLTVTMSFRDIKVVMCNVIDTVFSQDV